MGYLTKALTYLQLAADDRRVREEIEAMSPVQRERFRLTCAYWAEVAKPKPSFLRTAALLHTHDGRGRS